MPLPDVIPIVREAGFHTDTIGTYADGQFYASFHGAHQGEPGIGGLGPTLWYVYLHRFDRSGAYVSSEFDLVATGDRMTPAEREDGEQKLAALLDSLDGLVFGDIAIKPFRIEYQGVVFGLIDESEERDGEAWAELYPDGLGFSEPWTGEYDT